jgi:hypothetical protein
MALQAILSAIARPVFKKAMEYAWKTPAIRSRITLALSGITKKLGDNVSWEAIVQMAKDDPVSFTLLVYELMQLGGTWAEELYELLEPLLESSEAAKTAYDRRSEAASPTDSSSSLGLDYDGMIAPLTDEFRLLKRVCNREFGGNVERMLDFMKVVRMDDRTIGDLIKLGNFARENS